MITLLIGGLFLLFFGGLIFFSPKTVHKINHISNKRIAVDSKIFSHSGLLALVCIIVGILLIAVYIYSIFLT